MAARDERLREQRYSLQMSSPINSQLRDEMAARDEPLRVLDEQLAAMRRSLELLQIQQVSTSLGRFPRSWAPAAQSDPITNRPTLSSALSPQPSLSYLNLLARLPRVLGPPSQRRARKRVGERPGPPLRTWTSSGRGQARRPRTRATARPQRRSGEGGWRGGRAPHRRRRGHRHRGLVSEAIERGGGHRR